ncbi:hypothetical protein WSM22_41810 [Cytophagales bacterium WSM2-2]|nr:hypothetical protein WSM22_41810 [Cytophagales bacterium WSM2-2]
MGDHFRLTKTLFLPRKLKPGEGKEKAKWRSKQKCINKLVAIDKLEDIKGPSRLAQKNGLSPNECKSDRLSQIKSPGF